MVLVGPKNERLRELEEENAGQESAFATGGPREENVVARPDL